MFDDHTASWHWFDDVAAMRGTLARLDPARRAMETALDGLDTVDGWCCACDGWRTFRMPRPADGSWHNLRKSFVCECGLNGRMRASLSLIRTGLERLGPSPRGWLFERLTPLYGAVLRHGLPLEGSEYFGPSHRPGETVEVGDQRIRHESLLELSASDGSLDLLFHGDVLEHVPDHRRALAECARVLRPGGLMLFTAPFFDLDEHLVRCTVVNGELVHHLPPGYHGNPLSAEGSLVFTHFGWPLFDDIAAAGFSKVRMGLVYDTVCGVVSNNNPYVEGHMWPIFFAAQR
jgi:SAM-dependent methyltransferase